MSNLWSHRTVGEKRLIGVCIVVLVVAAYLVLTPAARSGPKLLSSKEADARTKSSVARAEKMRAERGVIAPEIDRLAFSKPAAEVVPSVVQTLQDLAKQSDIHLREIKPLRPRRMGDLTRIPISVRFSTGAFSQGAIAFLYRLEDPTSRMVIDKFSISAPDPKARVVDVEVQVGLYTRGAAGTDTGV